MAAREVYISGIGSFSPGNPVPFDQIEDVLGRITGAPPKLLKRIGRLRPIMKDLLGIEYSYYAIDPETRQATESNVSMCVKAARQALDGAGMIPEDVDLLVYAGILYDVMCPPSSVLVQDALKIPYCAEMSIHSNCTAIYKAIQVASDLIANGRYRNALIVTSQLSSTFLRAEYFNQKALTEEQAILRWFLSDGAGALVLTPHKPESACLKVVDTYLESVGMGIEPSMRMEYGASNWKVSDIYEHGRHHLTQDIATVSRLAPVLFDKGIEAMLAKTRLDVSTVKCFFVNIPTKHMMDVCIKNMKNNIFKNPDLFFYSKLATRGYPGAPAIIIALDDYMRDPPLQPGDRIVSFVTESSKWMHAGFILNTVNLSGIAGRCQPGVGPLCNGITANQSMRYPDTTFESSPIGILIPGIGVSYADAVRFMENEPRFQQCCQIAGLDAGYLKDQMLPSEIIDTLDTQKLSYVVNCVMCDLYKKRQIRLNYVVGYSMGIYAALYCGGYYAFETGLHILEKAFELISAYCESTPYDYEMGLILGLTESEIRRLLFRDVGEGIDIAVYNGERGFVIAGIREKVHICLQKAKASGALGVKGIQTHYPYHTLLLNHIFPPFFRYLNTLSFTVPSHKALSPIDGEEVTAENAANVIAKALCTPLHFEKVIHVLTADHHVQHCYETSPNKTMRNLVRYINRHIRIHCLDEDAV